MPEEQPSLHIDTDWKREAQEEKRRLAEQEKQRSTSAPAVSPPPSTAAVGLAPEPVAPPSGTERAAREMPQASFSTLISSILTQVLFYLGEVAPRGGEPVLNLDMAKHHIDTLGVLEAKTRGNLTPEEQRMLDSVLYDTRMRYVNVASQYIT